MERDPVCGMKLNNILEVPLTAYKGKMVYFCCPHCKELFDNNPETYMSGMHYDLNMSNPKPEKCKCEDIQLILPYDHRKFHH